MKARTCKTTQFYGFNQQRGKCLLYNAGLIQLEFIIYEAEILFRRQKSCYCNCQLYPQPSAETFSADSNPRPPHIYFFFFSCLPQSLQTLEKYFKLAQPLRCKPFPAHQSVINAVLNVRTALLHWMGKSLRLATPCVHSHTSRCKNKHL